MAEAHPTSVSDPAAAPVRGSSPNLVQNDVEALKQELVDVKTALQSLRELVENLTGVKAEAAALAIPPAVKDEPLDNELGERSEVNPAPAQQDNEQIGAEHSGVEQTDGLRNTSCHTSSSSEQFETPLPRRQSTEEPVWDTPPCGEVLFRINPEYARRIASANGVVAEPARIPTPSEDIPSRSPRLPSPPPVVRPTSPIKIKPTLQSKRRYTFELIIEVPSKRFKTSHYPGLDTFQDRPAASSSRNVLKKPVVAATRSPVGSRTIIKQIIRNVRGVSFEVSLDPKIRDISVTRVFLRIHFGSNNTHTFTVLPRRLAASHHYDHFAFICEHNSCQAPFTPGEPGLVTQFKENSWPTLDFYRVFVRVKLFPSEWQYMGLYTAKKLPAWTPEEIKRERTPIKINWARRVRESLWGRPILARILLRKELGREPTITEVKDKVEKIRKGSVARPSLTNIVAAFEKGEEKLYPWKLECIGYEEELQLEIALTFPHHTSKGQKRIAPANT